MTAWSLHGLATREYSRIVRLASSVKLGSSHASAQWKALNTVRAFQRVVVWGNCAFLPTATVDSKTSYCLDVWSMVFKDGRNQVSAICDIYLARARLKTAALERFALGMARKTAPITFIILGHGVKNVPFVALGTALNCPL